MTCPLSAANSKNGEWSAGKQAWPRSVMRVFYSKRVVSISILRSGIFLIELIDSYHR